jgi:hypothetical protein
LVEFGRDIANQIWEVEILDAGERSLLDYKAPTKAIRLAWVSNKLPHGPRALRRVGLGWVPAYRALFSPQLLGTCADGQSITSPGRQTIPRLSSPLKFPDTKLQ